MARTFSLMAELGTKAPGFILPDTVSDKNYNLTQLRGNFATVIMFICNHCPFVQHINKGIVNLASDYVPKGISFIAISANDVSAYPEDSPEKMKITAGEQGYPFPYLYDESQEVARNYQAVCTPDFFVYDRELKLVYRGQLDDARPGNGIPVSGKDIREALDCILHDKPVPGTQKPSIGCNIKWKSI